MKKLLVSDFDRTLYVESAIPAENEEALLQWQADGNLFAIATGRAEGILRILLERYGVTPDILICNNGAHIVTQSGTVIADKYIDRQTALLVMETLLLRYGAAVDVTLDANRVQVESTGGVDTPLGASLDISQHITLESFRADYRPALQIHTRFSTVSHTRMVADVLGQEFQKISAFANEYNLDIVANGLGKAEGINTLVHWSQFTGKVITIGDSYNDLDMLRLYNGYTLHRANPEIKRKVAHICESVAACIRQELIS